MSYKRHFNESSTSLVSRDPPPSYRSRVTTRSRDNAPDSSGSEFDISDGTLDVLSELDKIPSSCQVPGTDYSSSDEELEIVEPGTCELCSYELMRTVPEMGAREVGRVVAKFTVCRCFHLPVL